MEMELLRLQKYYVNYEQEKTTGIAGGYNNHRTSKLTDSSLHIQVCIFLFEILK